MKISGLVITYNEQKYIEDCINTLFKVCDEVIIIDSNSKDKTVEIAKNLGAKVYSQDFLGDGPQRIYGLQFCKNDWIYNPDADEFLDEDSESFIKSGSYINDVYDGYEFRRRNFLGDEEIGFACWYPDYACRFFNKKTASPSNDIVHQRVEGENIKRENVHLIHYGWDDFHQIIAKKNQYTDWQSKQFIEQNKKVNSFSPFLHGFSSFFKCYFLKKGIINGVDGFTFSLIQAFFSYMKYAKYLKSKKKNPAF
ncbi:glycosyltransferase family 2 protein [Lutibacter sp. TH_r2]|uniref:glycosyltransferase family 2 protein n=1 Tax=Lutibacter sp. TH_r2 TaxID=3082083 RepID=UPI002954067E|nr:glycosyltransferase family 2 protein [Lutibacter sp. TH_r2]MDV7187320.1 glycosyltransferase family 2 protein [Lutibacter sp. TH_r2]